MRRLLFTIFITFFLSIVNQSLLAQKDELPDIHIYTKLTVKGKNIGTYNVVVYCEGKVVEVLSFLNSEPEYIVLHKNRVYTIYYKKKEGTEEKSIIVDTKLPKHVDKKITLFKVHINVELDPSVSKLKEDASDFPSAIIKYDEKLKNFDYAKNYHKQVHQ